MLHESRAYHMAQPVLYQTTNFQLKPLDLCEPEVKEGVLFANFAFVK